MLDIHARISAAVRRGWLVTMRSALPFGKRIRQLRCQNGLTQRDLSERVGINFTYLSKIENNRAAPPSNSVIERLAKELDADVEELMALAGKVSRGDLRDAIADDPRIGVLFRKLLSGALTDAQIGHILEIAGGVGDGD